jgi:hypothetical protein
MASDFLANRLVRMIIHLATPILAFSTSPICEGINMVTLKNQSIAILVGFGLTAVGIIGSTPSANATDNILYLNSTRGLGTGGLGDFRQPIADVIDNYQDGTIFDVDFLQTHVPGSLASWLDANPVGYYNQIWFDTSISGASLLNQADLTALNTWAAHKQPEFILDSTFAYRNKNINTISNSAAAVTVNEALALRDAGGGIFIGTDHNQFAYTANQILSNFGFDGLFTGTYYPRANGSFGGNLLMEPESVGTDFFTNHIRGLSTSYVPVGTHILNENGGNRTIQIYEQLYSYTSNGSQVALIGTSFNNKPKTEEPKTEEPKSEEPKSEEPKTEEPKSEEPKSEEPKSEEPKSVPEPTSTLGLLAFGAFGVGSLVKRFWQEKVRIFRIAN